MTGPLDPPGPELARKSRRALAERIHWPDGVIDACEQIEAEFPDWHPYWSSGAYTAHRYDRDHREPVMRGATPAELRQAIETAPPPRADRVMRPVRPLVE